MSTQIGTITRSFTATATLQNYTLVKLETDGKVATATQVASGEVRVGFTCSEDNGQGNPVTIALLSGGGTVYATAEATVTIADALYGATGGKVGTTASGSVIGYALNSGVANDVIELLLA